MKWFRREFCYTRGISKKQIVRLRGRLVVYVGVLCCFSLAAQPSGYYDNAAGLTGEELQLALHEIIDDHSELSYSALWTAFQSTDKKGDGSVWDMYSDIPGSTPPYVYTFVSDQCGNYSGEGSCYNREHSFPKSWFDNASPMYTDLFHLYPTDGYVNGQRSNLPYGETENASWTSQNGSKVGPCSANGYSGMIFEPIDTYKGDLARTYFYMSTRYYGEDAGWPGSPMVDGSQLEPWAKEMLFQWHEEDPVSEKEISRNDEVYALQGNRNPFIDHPEFVQLMVGGEGFDEIPPDLDSIIVIGSTELLLWFNEALDRERAEQYAYYSISGGVVISQAALNEDDPRNVSLTLDALQNGNYALTINGVSDTAGNILQLAVYPFSVSGLTAVRTFSQNVSRIYPNPGRGTFFADIQDGRSDVQAVKLYDLSGRPFWTDYSIHENQIEIHTKAGAGSYLLIIELKSNTALRQLIRIE